MRPKVSMLIIMSLLLVAALIVTFQPGAEKAQGSEDFGVSNGGSGYQASTAPANTWYFAEGLATDDLKTLVNIVNPGGTQASASFEFYVPEGSVAGPTLNVAPGESKTIDIGNWIVSDEVGFKISSTQPILAQRTAYGMGLIEANPGGSSTSTTFYFAEGTTGPGWGEWISIINPGTTDTTCTLRYDYDTGLSTRNYQVAGGSRKTLFVNEEIGSYWNVSIKLDSIQPVYAERTMIFTRNDQPGMHISPGALTSSTDWYFSSETNREGFEGWLIISNPGSSMSGVMVDLCYESQAPTHYAVDIQGRTKMAIPTGELSDKGPNYSIHVKSDEAVVAEFTSYFDYTSDYLEGICVGGACFPGSTSPAKDFVIPGGEVNEKHEQWIGLSNFGGTAANITVKAYTSQGTVNKAYSIPAMRNKLVNVNRDIIASGEIYRFELSSATDFTAGKMDFYSSYGVPLPPGAEHTWYFAEGCTREGFSEYLCLQNPAEKEIQVHAVYMLFGEDPREEVYPVAPNSRNSVYVNAAVGEGKDVSVLLWSEDEFYAERPMYFSYKQGQPGYSWDGGHVTFGVKAPRTDWYFAEGCTRSGFEEWLCIQNPTEMEADVTITYILAGAMSVEKNYLIPPQSRFSVNVNADVWEDQDVSAYVHSKTPIVCERPMYFRYNAVYNPGSWTGGSVVMGTSAPKKEWYFAEGCTRSGFEEWICIQNPSADAAFLDVTYNTSGGVVEKEYAVPAKSRHTLSVNAEVGQDKDVSCHISSDQNIICERPLYFNYTGYGASGWDGGSAEVGVYSPKTEWYFAEGYTGGLFHEWICIQNTGSETANVSVTYNIQGGSPQQKVHQVQPGRYTIFVNQDAGPDLQLSTHLSSDKPIICERSMYFNYNDWTDGHCAAGYAP